MSYLKFLNLVQAIRELPSFPAIDPVEERVLNLLATAWQAGQQISVVEAMNTLTEMSPSTVHRRLKLLRKKGLIQLDEDGDDNRIKYIASTPLALRYFKKLDECLEMAQKT